MEDEFKFEPILEVDGGCSLCLADPFFFLELNRSFQDLNQDVPVSFEFAPALKMEMVMAMETGESLESPAIEEAGKVDPSEEASWKRSKRERREPAAALYSDHSVCDRCKRHGQRCDGQTPCGYCSVGGFACERAMK